MSSEELRHLQTDEISDLATAKLSLRWSLEEIRQLDEEVQRLSNRVIAKEEESSRLSKELAHQSSITLNEKELTAKTQQLLDEYRNLMDASMEQLWKKFAPQEASAKKQLQDKITALEHDLLQSTRIKDLSGENLKKAEENLAR